MTSADGWLSLLVPTNLHPSGDGWAGCVRDADRAREGVSFLQCPIVGLPANGAWSMTYTFVRGAAGTTAGTADGKSVTSGPAIITAEVDEPDLEVLDPDQANNFAEVPVP